MLRTLRNTGATVLALSMAAGPVMAQVVVAPPTATAEAPAPVTAAPPAVAATAPVAAAVPQALADLGVTEGAVRPGKHGGQRFEGKFADGTAVHAALDDAGRLAMIRAADDARALPPAAVERLVPQPVRDAAITRDFATLSGVALRDGMVGLFGRDAAGQELRAGFDPSGTLMRFGRGDVDRGAGKGWPGKDGPGKDRPGKDGGERGPRDGKGHGPKDGHPHGPGKGPERHGADRHHDQRPGGPGGAPGADRGPQAGPVEPLTPDRVQTILGDAGYTQIGQVSQDGPRTLAQAVSPEGNPVTVTLNPRGVVVRELAR